MRKTLHELAAGYAAASGCLCQSEDGSCQAVLTVEGLDVHIGLVESSGMIVFQTGVALLPQAGREEFCMKLLAANNLFLDTMGFTLGVDEHQELVTIQLAWDLSHLKAESFARIVNNLLAVAADWMIRLNEWRPSSSAGEGSAPAENSGEVPFMNFLKV